MAVSIFSVGFLGPKKDGPGKATPPPSVVPGQTGQASPLLGQPPGLGPDGITHYQPAAGDLRTSSLPTGVSTGTMAAVGTRIYFAVDSNKIETTVIGSDAPPRIVAAVNPCQSVADVAAAGDSLAYVVVGSGTAGGIPGACGLPPVVTWSVVTTDLNGAHSRTVANGRRAVANAESRRHPVHVALTPTLLAFDSHNSPGTMAMGETIEVLRLTDLKLLWSVRTSGQVLDLRLGGSTIAVLEDNEGQEVDVADEVSPALFPIARPATSMGLSSDGRYLSWDAPAGPGHVGGSSLVTVALPSGARDPLTSFEPFGVPTVEPRRPAVSATAVGTIIAWHQTFEGGVVYAAFRDHPESEGAVVSSVPSPNWIDLQGSTLILVATDDSTTRTRAVAIDLSKSGFSRT